MLQNDVKGDNMILAKNINLYDKFLTINNQGKTVVNIETVQYIGKLKA